MKILFQSLQNIKIVMPCGNKSCEVWDQCCGLFPWHFKSFLRKIKHNQSDFLSEFDLFLTIGGKQEMCGILLWQPSDLVDLLLYLQTLQVIKVRFVTLKRAVDVVLSRVPHLACFLCHALGLKGAEKHFRNHFFTICIDALWRESCTQRVNITIRWPNLGFSLKDDHSATFIPCCQQVPCLVEFHCRDDIGWKGHKENGTSDSGWCYDKHIMTKKDTKTIK